ncbi:adenine phosphoribosyltransferase [candidate division FCPU426 bacterium]|nr:adenine phosphoribosyltransferase [candidate division FCPU426 bacterium]
MLAKIKEKIRDIPDFPKAGIIFKDITPLLADAEGFAQAVNAMAEHFQGLGITKVVCVEARGFIIGAPLAARLGAGIVPVRKPGKLPYQTIQQTYALEYGTDTLEMHVDAIAPGDRVLIADDLLATGGTVAAVVELVKKLKGEILGLAFLIELDFLHGRNKLKGQDIFTLIHY